MSSQNKALLGLAIVAHFFKWFFGLFKKPVPEKVMNTIYKAIAEELKANPNCQQFTNVKSAITGESFNCGWLDAGMIPLISDQGFLLATHGDQNGRVSIGPDQSGTLVFVDPWDERFTRIWAPGTFVTVLSCYPAYRPAIWQENGVTFINASNEPVPVYLPCINGTVYYCPMPYQVALALKMI